MGSLMAGWSSPVKDPNSIKYHRNKSLTRGEIDAFWRAKKMTEEEHLNEIYSPGSNISQSQENMYDDLEDEAEPERVKRSASLPLNLVDKKDGLLDTWNPIKLTGWWTRSNSAFLNEPPVIAVEGASHKYASQHHVANLIAGK